MRQVSQPECRCTVTVLTPLTQVQAHAGGGHHPLLGDLLAGMSSAPQPPAAALVVQAKLTRSAATPWDILSWAHRLSWTGIVNPDMTTAITCNPVRLWKYCNTPGMRSIFSARKPWGGLENRIDRVS